ncbi:hypothetical protein [Edwardsiella tarda]|uniref:hypothetical protein n=1 Tax=Edwardsiella tarda TaxID=636 RepID=UPI0012675214|nr:hypothetical protein [Edwardsiella tarda]
MSKVMIITYGIFFLLVIPGVALFTNGATINMENLDRLGSYLSGIGTVVAAVAAVYGINGWVKQLTHGKYLDIIWEAKINLRKVYLSKNSWYGYAKIAATKCNSKLDNEANEYWDKLDSACKSLSTSFSSIDQIIVRDDFKWQNQATDLHRLLKDTNNLLKELITSDESEQKLHEKNKLFHCYYNSLLNQLDELEKKHSK